MYLSLLVISYESDKARSFRHHGVSFTSAWIDKWRSTFHKQYLKTGKWSSSAASSVPLDYFLNHIYIKVGKVKQGKCLVRIVKIIYSTGCAKFTFNFIIYRGHFVLQLLENLT